MFARFPHAAPFRRRKANGRPGRDTDSNVMCSPSIFRKDLLQFQAGFSSRPSQDRTLTGPLVSGESVRTTSQASLPQESLGHTFCQAVSSTSPKIFLRISYSRAQSHFDLLVPTPRGLWPLGPRGRITSCAYRHNCAHYLEVEHGLAGHSFDFALDQVFHPRQKGWASPLAGHASSRCPRYPLRIPSVVAAICENFLAIRSNMDQLSLLPHGGSTAWVKGWIKGMHVCGRTGHCIHTSGRKAGQYRNRRMMCSSGFRL